jgi:chaperonin GroEL (HSP60 family)
LVCVIDNLINLTSPLNFLYYNTYDNIRQEKIENLTKKISIRNALKDFFDFKLSNSRALQNAASIASMVLTTESIVTEKKEEKCSCGGHETAGAGMEGMY